MTRKSGKAVDFIEVDNSAEDQMRYKLRCPVCSMDYVCVDTTKIHKSRSMDTAGTVWAGRGNTDDIAMIGECGHKFHLRLGFHKGQTFIFMDVTMPTEK